MNLYCWPFKSEKKQDYINQTQGTTAVEFAVVAPVFFLLFMGIFEIGSMMYVQQALNLAILHVSRFGRTGDTVAGQTAKQTAASLVSQYTLGLVDVSKLTLTATTYANFAAVPTNSQVLAQKLNTGNQDFGITNQIVLYTLTYNWTFYTPLVGKFLSSNGVSKTLIASTVVQNEPF